MRVLSSSDEDAVAAATAALDAGELIVIPGDLEYYVAADALDDTAVERVFEVTGRGADQPLLVLLGGYEDLHHVAYGSGVARALAEEHWPGPTALAVKARPWIPDALTAGQEEVAVLVPRQPFARALARRFGPIALAPAAGARAVALEVDAGALPGGEAKVIRATEPAPV
jgi:L-threonylcarbamoyladenylate synthase